jgi:hypothetical protein
MGESNQTIIIKNHIESMERRYNPECDVIPGAPSVTWADEQLLYMIKHLVIVVEDLQDQIDKNKLASMIF